MATTELTTGVYLVPRDGTVKSVTITDHDDLRRFRTELEILRRVARIVANDIIVEPKGGDSNDETRRDLFNAVTDAGHPVVEEVVALIDNHNPELRKEILMSVVNEEAENIVQEAIESGVIATDSGNAIAKPPPVATDSATVVTPQPVAPAQSECPGDPPPPAPPAKTDTACDTPPEDLPVEEALAKAQDELNKAVEAGQETAGPNADTPAASPKEEDHDPAASNDKATPEAAPGTSGTEDEGTSASAEQGVAQDPAADVAEALSNNPDDINIAENAASDIEAELDACLDAKLNAAVAEESTNTPDAALESAIPGNITDANDLSPFGDYTADKATAAVEEIEHGIRKLADLLSNDVSTQWKQAQDAFVQVLDARTKAGSLHEQAARMAREIARMKEEIEISRDDADIARREAKLMREDARLAKQRAEDFASAAGACAPSVT